LPPAPRSPAFYILAKILTQGFGGAAGSAVWHGYVSGWTPVIAVVATLSMVLGKSHRHCFNPA